MEPIVPMVPIVIVCYNNYKYVDNTIKQIKQINNEYAQNIIIINNNSFDLDTIRYIKESPYKIINNENLGPRISPVWNRHIYHILPAKFILTDPDLEFNLNLPKNFIEDMINISEKHKIYKLGFALDISDYDKMMDGKYYGPCTIYDWEYQFWKNRIDDKNYELYDALVDTTFCLINKENDNNNYARIAGNFTAKHLPWYKENTIYNTYDNYNSCLKQSRISTTSSLIKTWTENNYLKIDIQKEFFFINKTQSLNLQNTTLKNTTLEILDKLLNPNKIFINIGGGIGETCMYASRKSKEVFVIETDINKFNDLINNCKLNCNNVTCINDIKISPIEYYIEKYNINPSEISLINVDIEVNEIILENIYIFSKKYKIPFDISFNYNLWEDKNLHRISFLTNEQITTIITNPFCNILFENNNINSSI